MTTTVLVFHDDFAKSHANRALADAAAALPDVEVVVMDRLYPTIADLDAGLDREVARLLAAGRLVLQFPVQWYSTPALLSGWADTLLTRMYYQKPDEEGARLKGLPVTLAATAGNEPAAYTAEGQNGFPLRDLLRPLDATARRCGWVLTEPFLLYRANRLDEGERAEAGRAYARHLADWIAATPPLAGR